MKELEQLIKEQRNNIATVIYSDKISNPIKILELEAILRMTVISVIDLEIERIEILKILTNNYTGRPASVLDAEITHLKSLKELIK